MASTHHVLTDFTILGTPVGTDSDDALASPAEQWTSALVPGGVHESLLAAGTIEHPYYDVNEPEVRWIEERDWWYRSEFEAPEDLEDDERLRLVFHGLDTVVDIWINGELIGSHENMFRSAEFDVTDQVRPRNTLLLRFSPPLADLDIPPSAADLYARLAALVAAGEGADPADAPGGPDAGLMSSSLGLATLRRKAAFSWGWDFGPRVPSIGIWRPVELVRERRAVIASHLVQTTATDAVEATASVTVVVEADAFAVDGALTACVSLTSPSGMATVAELDLVIGESRATGSADLHVAEAHLWWSHDLGSPIRYDVSIALHEDGEHIDEITDRVGLRTITLDRGEDSEGGNRFRFMLNGVPVFARGAAWLPASMLVGSVTPHELRSLVQTARDGNMNMLRVWGGGIYEHDAFYEACDEFGVLIWHDFMFACIDYPSQDPRLQREVSLEAEYQIRRLRNRASIALWCGNNEVHMIHGAAYGNLEPGNWGSDFFNRILPEAVERWGGGVPYWPGSPYGEAPAGTAMPANGMLDGDRHNWEVWHGFNFGADREEFTSVGEARHYRRYAADKGKFISEFGIHAAPELGTLQRWIPPEALAVPSASFDHHNKDNPSNKGDAILEIITGLPTNIDEYVDFTMVSQAEGLKFGIEHYRRRQPHCNGTLVWQFNDVWPGVSWSVVDFDTVPKAGYYYAKRAFAPTVATFRHRADGRLEMWASNSGRTEVITGAIVSVAEFDGTISFQETIELAVRPGESHPVWTAPEALDIAATSQFAWVESTDGAFPSNRRFFAEIKDLEFEEGALDVKRTRTSTTEAVIDIASHGFNYLVRLSSPPPGIRFSDNYFDLRDGDTTHIHVSNLRGDVDIDGIVVMKYVG